MSALSLSGTRARLMLLVMLAVFPALALILYLGHTQATRARETALEEARQLTRLASADHLQLVEDTRQLLIALSHLPEVTARVPGCNAFLAKLNSGYSHYANLGAISPHGDVYCSAHPPSRPANSLDRPWFRRAIDTRQFTIGDYQVGRITGRPVIVASFPDYDSEGHLRAVLFAAIDLVRANQWASKAQLPPGVVVALLDSHGTILSRYPEPEKWLGKSHADSALFHHILASSGEGTTDNIGLDGQRHIYAFAPLPYPAENGHVYAYTSIPHDLVYAEIDRALAHTLVSLAMVTLLVLLAAWFGGEFFLLRRINALVATARRLTQGDLTARTGIAYTRNELNELARSIDEMATALQVRNAEFARALNELRESNELLEKLFGNFHFLIVYLDRDFKFIRVNRAYADICGYPPEFFVGKNHFALYPHPGNESIFQHVVDTGEPYTVFAKAFVFPDHPERGVTYWDWSLHPVRDAAGKISGLMFGLVHVTDRVKAEQQADYLQYHDELTGLPKRALLLDRLRQAVIEAERHHRQVAVICLDIDRFKFVNETHGHHAGDAVIKTVAERLRACVRPGDTVARLGGGEFAIELSDLAHPDDVSKVANKIITCADTPLSVAGNNLFVTHSVGITLFPLDGEDPEALLKNAEAAMHQAKQRGGNNYQFYSVQMTVEAAEHLMLESGLRQALERNEFLLHYQPQVNLKTGKIIGMEALIRWQHPEKDLISPMKFIPLAEETGFIVPLGEWVIEMACTQIRAWQEAGLPPLRVSVNISVQQFKQPGLDETVKRILQKTGVAPHLLDIELTESALALNPDTISGILRNLALLGVQISIDDFGTGYSSLSYLKRFPVDVLKIDQSFVRDIPRDPDDAAIAMAIIGMAHTLGIQTIAEGVETKEQMKFLRKHRCDAMQGYYFSKPLPAGDVAMLLRESRGLGPAKT